MKLPFVIYFARFESRISSPPGMIGGSGLVHAQGETGVGVRRSIFAEGWEPLFSKRVQQPQSGT